jgi:Abortive infection alpha
LSDSDEKPATELIKAGVEVVKIAYVDALQPVAKEAGKALGTVGKAVNTALAPIRGLVWGWEKIELYLTETVTAKIEKRNIPSDRILAPPEDLAVPLIEALRYSKLKDNFAELLTTAMDSQTAGTVHPAYVEILKQMNQSEAMILKSMPNAKKAFVPLMDLLRITPEKGQFFIETSLTTFADDLNLDPSCDTPQSIDNLRRLGLLETPENWMLVEDNRYERIRAMPTYKRAQNGIPSGCTFMEKKRTLGLTDLGLRFKLACIEP